LIVASVVDACKACAVEAVTAGLAQGLAAAFVFVVGVT
jgi:hypothetical protein